MGSATDGLKMTDRVSAGGIIVGPPPDAVGWRFEQYGPGNEAVNEFWFDRRRQEFRWRRMKPCARCGATLVRGFERAKVDVERSGHDLGCWDGSFQVPVPLCCSKCHAPVLI